MKAEVEKLKAKHSTEQKRTDVVQLNEVVTFDSVCSASDEILLMSSNVERKVYQVLIQKDGIGLVGSVTQLFS